MAKRMKHVFDTGEVPHLWAHQSQESARNPQGNLYFDGDTIYSYGSHFPIARHVKNAKGRAAILFTTQTYSRTTSGHCSAVRGAIPSEVQVFHVQYVREVRAEMREDYMRQIGAELILAENRRSETLKQLDAGRAGDLIQECRAFCQFFKFAMPKFPKLPQIDKSKLAVEKTRQEARWAKQREERKRQNEEWERQNEERKRQEALELPEKIARWRAGEYFWSCSSWPTILRIKDGEVETSRGAKVPLNHARRALEFVRKVRESGQDWERNGHSFHLGVYQIDKVEANGTLHAGCHVISWEEIERFAPTLEAVTVTASAEEIPPSV
jgi:hypothetical protein